MDEVKRYQLVAEFEDAEQDNTFTLALSNLKFKNGKYPNRYSNKVDLQAAIKSFKFTSGGTYTAKAMLEALQNFKQKERKGDSVAKVRHIQFLSIYMYLNG